MSTLIMLAGMFGIMYLFMIRPEMKRQKKPKPSEMRSRRPARDHWRCARQVVSVSEKTVVIEFESGKARVDKTALSPNGTAESQELEAKA